MMMLSGVRVFAHGRSRRRQPSVRWSFRSRWSSRSSISSSLLPRKRKQQKVQEFLDNLKVNDRVITTSGIYGQITRLGEQSVQLQIADKVRIEVARAAIGGYQGQAPVVEPTANP